MGIQDLLGLLEPKSPGRKSVYGSERCEDISDSKSLNLLVDRRALAVERKKVRCCCLLQFLKHRHRANSVLVGAPCLIRLSCVSRHPYGFTAPPSRGTKHNLVVKEALVKMGQRLGLVGTDRPNPRA